MELKKRDEVIKREYAQKDEISKNEVKKFTPKKWLIASSLGVVTLFYANPNGIFGSIGVVFGCIDTSASATYELTNLGNILNSISNISGIVAIFLFLVAALDNYILNKKIKEINILNDDEEKKAKQETIENIRKIIGVMIIIGAVFLIIFAIWEYGVSNIESPLLYDLSSSDLNYDIFKMIE